MSGAADARVRFVSGNIAGAVVDAIVNPVSHGFLMGFAGVNGALRAAGGPEYVAECERLPTTASGALWPTGAGRLNARCVLHVVSPIWSTGQTGEGDALRRVHERLLAGAADLGCRSIALPAIGCGGQRFPVEVAASIAVPTVEHALVQLPQIERVDFYFLSRSLLHDYYLHSQTYAGEESRLGILRDDIVHWLQHDPALAARVARIDDEAVLRSIDETARELDRTLAETSIDSAFVYARAARQVLDGTPAHSNE